MKYFILPAGIALLALGCKKDPEDTGGDTVFTDADTDADTDSDTDTDTDTDTTDTDTDTTDTDPPADPFVFLADDPSTYNRVDRMGMPAIATAVIMNKDAYNAANPTDDLAGTFVPEIEASVGALHAALDDDLLSLLLVPCATGECIDQAAPLVIPDTLSIDTTGTAGFPNGRMLPDQVIDITLAVILLDLDLHGVRTFADMPLNPPANDAAFNAAFPYLAAAH